MFLPNVHNITLPGDGGGGQGAVSAAGQVEAITRRHGDGGRGDVRAGGDRWGGETLVKSS